MKRSSIIRRTAMKRGGWIRREKPLRYRGRRAETRITKSGRVIMGRKEYTALCRQVWERDGGRCTIQHEGCWGILPFFCTAWCDHRTKRSQGGSDSMENLRLACPPCHDWADQQGGKNKEKTA